MMSKLTLLDKLKILGDVTSSSGLFVVAIVILVSLAILLIATNTKTKKISKFICIAIYGSITIVSIMFYREELFEMFDYMMDNLFIAVYFPNLAIYFAAIITTNIILWISIFNRKITKWIRVINTTVFCIIHYLLILIINIINKGKLDIFDQTSIYQNKNALGLIELSSTIFVTWILFLIIYKIIRIYQQNQEIESDEIKNNPEPIIIREKASEPIIKTETVYKRKLPDNIVKIDIPSIVYGSVKRKEEPKDTPKTETTSIIDFMKQPVESDNSYLMDIPNFVTEDTPQFLDMMLNNNSTKEIIKQKALDKKEKIVSPKSSKIKVIKEPTIVTKVVKVNKEVPETKNTVTDMFDNLLTLEDYKKVLAILKSYKEKEHQQAQLEKRQENRNISINEFQQLIGKNTR